MLISDILIVMAIIYVTISVIFFTIHLRKNFRSFWKKNFSRRKFRGFYDRLFPVVEKEEEKAKELDQ